MLSSKFIAHFFDEVSAWQIQLSNADQVINTWMEVQRAWIYLESIFIGSEDIRKQLPEDSKRFDQLDKDFRVSKAHLFIVKVPFNLDKLAIIFLSYIKGFKVFKSLILIIYNHNLTKY